MNTQTIRYCRVLIVDDEQIMRQGIRHMLDWESNGFQVVGEASNGKIALEVVKETNPDIIIADVVMPIMDGIAFSEVICRRYPWIQLIMLSGHDNFDYVKKTLIHGAVDYILKTALTPDMLLSVLKKASGNIEGLTLVTNQHHSEAYQLERYISGFQKELKEEDFANVLLHSSYRILALDTQSLSHGDKTIIPAIIDYIHLFFQDKPQYVVLYFNIKEHIPCFLINYRFKDDTLLKNNILICSQKLEQLYDGTFFVLSQMFRHISHIKERYTKQIAHSVSMHFYHPTETLLIQEENTQTEMERFDFEAYSQALEHKEFITALNLYITYLDTAQQANMHVHNIKNIAKNLLYNYCMELEKHIHKIEDLQHEYFSKIEGAPHYIAFQKVLDEIQNRIFTLLEEHIHVKDKRIKEIKKYLAANYKQDLDLSILADLFGLNYSYLSFYFNQHMGQDFKGYLNHLRINKASDLLKQTDKSISEISHEVGYTDHSYFCRVFKKLTNKSPRDYRRAYMEKNTL
ncbi:MAG: response regulator [Lachnospiraceae bacterium]|nr:response regulator [Lachnospiraceae bacterium]